MLSESLSLVNPDTCTFQAHQQCLGAFSYSGRVVQSLKPNLNVTQHLHHDPSTAYQTMMRPLKSDTMRFNAESNGSTQAARHAVTQFPCIMLCALHTSNGGMHMAVSFMHALTHAMLVTHMHSQQFACT
jgi:hypothetical protein